MIALLAATTLTAFAAPPACLPSTVRTTPGVAVALQTNCTQGGTVTVKTQPVSGTLTGLPGTYTPAPGFHGVDHLSYTVTNAADETSEETSINLVVNSLPVCADGTATTRVNTPLKLTFPCSDPDGDTVLVRAEDGAHGAVDPDVGSDLTYTPEPGYVGTDRISFSGMNGGYETPVHTLTITITPEATATPTATATATPVPTAPAAPTPAPPAPDTTAPSVTVKAGKASIAKGVALTLRSNEAGTAKLTLTTGKNKSTRSAKLVNGTTKVTLKLSAKARKALERKRSVKAKLTLVAADAAGNRTTKKLSVTLRASGRR